MTKPHFYQAFGLSIQSDFAFDVLEPLTDPAPHPDLIVRRVSGLKRDHHAEDPVLDVQPNQQYFHWNAVGTFEIKGPSLVVIEPNATATDHLVSQPFLGIVLSVVLELRDLLCLHASAVSVGPRAIAFLGDKGAGKSTTAGALIAQGFQPVSDDLVPIDCKPNAQPILQSGFSSMKLWPDSHQALSLDSDGTDRLVHQSSVKIQKNLGMPPPSGPLSVSALFLLNRTEQHAQFSFERLPSHEALDAIMRFTFMARYGETKLGQDHLIQHMTRCGRLAAEVPVVKFFIPADLVKLKQLASAVCDYLDLQSEPPHRAED